MKNCLKPGAVLFGTKLVFLTVFLVSSCHAFEDRKLQDGFDSDLSQTDWINNLSTDPQSTEQPAETKQETIAEVIDKVLVEEFSDDKKKADQDIGKNFNHTRSEIESGGRGEGEEEVSE